jgi:hypothetical protein
MIANDESGAPIRWFTKLFSGVRPEVTLDLIMFVSKPANHHRSYKEPPCDYWSLHQTQNQINAKHSKEVPPSDASIEVAF